MTVGRFKKLPITQGDSFLHHFLSFMKNANKNTQKGVDAESKESAGRDWLANFSEKKPSFLKSGQILTFRRRVPETKKHIIYFISIYGNFIFLEHDLKN